MISFYNKQNDTIIYRQAAKSGASRIPKGCDEQRSASNVFRLPPPHTLPKTRFMCTPRGHVSRPEKRQRPPSRCL